MSPQEMELICMTRRQLDHKKRLSQEDLMLSNCEAGEYS